MTDAEIPEDLLPFRGHRVHRLEYAPHKVPLILDDSEFKVDSAGVELLDDEWIDQDDPLWCSCEAKFDDEAAAKEHLREIGDVEEAVLARLYDVHGLAYAWLAKKDAGRFDKTGPFEMARERGVEITPEKAPTIADQYVLNRENTDEDRLDAMREALGRRDGLDRIEERGGVIPTESDR